MRSSTSSRIHKNCCCSLEWCSELHQKLFIGDKFVNFPSPKCQISENGRRNPEIKNVIINAPDFRLPDYLKAASVN